MGCAFTDIQVGWSEDKTSTAMLEALEEMKRRYKRRIPAPWLLITTVIVNL
jgi:hypothetical protein